MRKAHFDHEKLRVYQDALRFVAFTEAVLANVPGRLSAKDQLERASISIALNIAEGNGKRSKTDRCRYLDAARGSALECAACLDILVLKKQLTDEEAEAGKEILVGIVSMLVGLLDSLGGLLNEEPGAYGLAVAASEHEHD